MGNKKSAPFLEHLPVTHVRQATISANCEILPISDRHLFRGLVPTTSQQDVFVIDVFVCSKLVNKLQTCQVQMIKNLCTG
jgi:hypothetical protein